MYCELHAKTNFSFLEGASHPDEIVRQAAEMGCRAVAITDRAGLAGIVRAHIAAKEAGIKLVIGAEIEPGDSLPVVLWATDRASYGRLCRLITRGRRRAEKGRCSLAFADVAEHAEGLLAGVIPRLQRPGELLPHLREYRALFGDRGYLLCELYFGPNDRRRREWLCELSR
ncbi:MAG: PHP domain-containing protein, partial [Thermogutta sp.]|nr:PHP domain-containing protein [Thermogutta sp.]